MARQGKEWKRVKKILGLDEDEEADKLVMMRRLVAECVPGVLQVELRLGEEVPENEWLENMQRLGELVGLGTEAGEVGKDGSEEEIRDQWLELLLEWHGKDEDMFETRLLEAVKLVDELCADPSLLNMQSRLFPLDIPISKTAVAQWTDEQTARDELKQRNEEMARTLEDLSSKIAQLRLDNDPSEDVLYPDHLLISQITLRLKKLESTFEEFGRKFEESFKDALAEQVVPPLSGVGASARNALVRIDRFTKLIEGLQRVTTALSSIADTFVERGELETISESQLTKLQRTLVVIDDSLKRLQDVERGSIIHPSAEEAVSRIIA